MDQNHSFRSFLIFMVFQNLAFGVGLAQFVEDVCIWRPQLQIVDCDDTTITSMTFQARHEGYTQLSIKGTHLQNLSFNVSFLPDLKIVDARNTSLGCQKIAPSILEVIDHVIVDEKSCYNTICCWKFRVTNDSIMDSRDSNNYIKGMPNAPSTRSLDMLPLQDKHQPAEDVLLTKNHTHASSHSVVHQNVGVNLVKNQVPNAISVSTQVKINFGESITKKQPEKQTRSESSLEADMTIVYSVIGICCVTSLVSLCLSIYTMCTLYRRRSCSFKGLQHVTKVKVTRNCHLMIINGFCRSTEIVE